MSSVPEKMRAVVARGVNDYTFMEVDVPKLEEGGMEMIYDYFPAISSAGRLRVRMMRSMSSVRCTLIPHFRR